MKRAFAFLLLTTAALPAWALDIPQPGRADPHMRIAAYDPLNRVQLTGEIDRQTTVTFSPREQIVRVIFGQTSTAQEAMWEGPDPKDVAASPLKNVLPLWAHKPGNTNLQVTTATEDGSLRVYQFALRAVSPLANGEDDPEATFGLAFTYPGRDQAGGCRLVEAAARAESPGGANRQAPDRHLLRHAQLGVHDAGEPRVARE